MATTEQPQVYSRRVVTSTFLKDAGDVLAKRVIFAIALFWLVFVALLSPLLASSTAHGQVSPPLQYRAAEDCPDYDAFSQMLTAKLQGSASALSRVISIAVDITGVGQGHQARIDLLERSGAVTTRELSAGACAEAAAAAAVSIAILLDALPDAPSTAVESEPAASVVHMHVDDPAPAHAESAVPAIGWQAGVGLAANGAFGLSTHLVLTPGLVFWLAAPPRGALAPELDLLVTYANSGTLNLGTQSARLDWLFSRLDLCPLAWRQKSWAVRPCAVAEAGTVTGVELHTIDAKHVVRPWLATGALLRWQAEVFGPGFLRAEVGAVASMWAYQFRFGPSAVVYGVARIGLRLGITVGLHFP